MPLKRDGEITSVGDELKRYLRSRGLVRTSRESMVPVVWSEIVGQWYTRRTRVIRVDRGAVTVRCDSPSCAQQLQLDSALIIERLNERLEGRVVRELRPTSAGITRSPVALSAAEASHPLEPCAGDLARMDLEWEEREWVDGLTAALGDDELRRRVETVLVKHCKVTRWRRAHGHCPCRLCGVLVRPGRTLCPACDPGRIPMQGSPDVLDGWWPQEP